MTNDLVRINHADATRKHILFVPWTIGNICNYQCDYCPPQLHNGTRKWIPPHKILLFAGRLIASARSRGKTVCIQLSTGEITLMPGLLDVLGELKQMGSQLAIISNGSKSQKFWRQVVTSLDHLVLSFHPGWTEIQHFREIVDVASGATRTHINIAAPPSYFDKAVAAAEYLVANCRDVTILLKPMLIDFKTQLYPYSVEQMAVFRERSFIAETTRPIVDVRGDMIAEFANGELRTLEASQFLVENINHWRGWDCYAGVEVLSIKYSGEIYRGVCGEGGPIGNVNRPSEFDLPIFPVRCSRETCSCLLDVMTTRHRPLRGEAEL
jgi:hypothetical protein